MRKHLRRRVEPTELVDHDDISDVEEEDALGEKAYKCLQLVKFACSQHGIVRSCAGTIHELRDRGTSMCDTGSQTRQW